MIGNLVKRLGEEGNGYNVDWGAITREQMNISGTDTYSKVSYTFNFNHEVHYFTISVIDSRGRGFANFWSDFITPYHLSSGYSYSVNITGVSANKRSISISGNYGFMSGTIIWMTLY